MTPYLFNVLQENQKLPILRSGGSFIADRKVDGYSVVLYQLFSFYVEVWYKQDLNEPVMLYAFNNMEQLERYLDMIDVSLF